ncbi:MAG: hypothetical protein C5B59_06575 [Bacteroidetes bacterium]|nr:MAG: hypothetical protein C5B59_06575 [Bacteroidota bacterium]
MAEEISRWAFTQMVREVDCPRCNEPAGQACRTPRGRLALTPHTERGVVYMTKIGRAEFESRHSFKMQSAPILGGAS